MDQDESSKTVFPLDSFHSPTFGKDGSFYVNEAVGSASISPAGRDVVLASREGLHIIDLDNPFSPPRHLPHRTPWEVADVQWSPFASRDYWVVSTSNQKALVWNLDMKTSQAPIQYVLHAHSRAISDINFSAHDPDKLATCAIDSFVHCWDLRQPTRPVISFADWFAGATQVKWNRQESHLIASSHDRYLHIWDERKAVSPLKTIEAHATKIYGIDWSRTEPTSILTCSLDKTIKCWNYSHPGDIPTKIIRTDYPVWRARHTPFGSGVLAMPQRDNNGLHLYDLRSSNEIETTTATTASPVHSFMGHHDQVKEFLWRTQGSFDDGIDNRNFQLVSWSTDRNLLLHGLDESIYSKVGFKKGEEADDRLKFTREGAVYRSFHKESNDQSPKASGPGLSTLFRDKNTQGMRKAPIPLTGWDGRELTSTSVNGMRVKNTIRSKDRNPIEWMKGVKIGDSIAARDGAPPLTALPWANSENLGDEITIAGEMYGSVTFDQVDVSARVIDISLSGPWGVDDTSVYLKATITFPLEYPEQVAADVKVERTSYISDASFTRINVEIRVICQAYASIGRGSIRAILRYLLGEYDLQRSLARVDELKASLRRDVDNQSEDSSSDEEEAVIGPSFRGGPYVDMEASGGDILGVTSANANVPLPKACGALWAEDGRLVCFFPHKGDSTSTFQLFDFNSGERRPRSSTLFESFGRLPHIGLTSEDKDSDADSQSSSDSSTVFSVSSSGSEVDGFIPHLKPFWPTSTKPLIEPSVNRHLGGNSSSPTAKTSKAKQFITLHDFSEILPSKRVLAEEYLICDDARHVCNHNAMTALNHGFTDLADVWSLLGFVLCDEVPLELISQPSGAADVFVLARRALVQIKKRDSGLDLAFDEPETVLNATIRGKVMWGNHPLAGRWMINKIFEHFEHVGDVQMLAMLSCVLCETEKRSSSLQKQKDSRDALRFSPEYYASPAAALSSLSSKSSLSLHAKVAAPATAFGSVSLSTGLWSNEEISTDKKTPNSESSSSPRAISRQNSRTSYLEQSLSSSPERPIQRSNSVASNALAASFSRQFASFLNSASSSPPNQSKTPELSTSAPSSGVTWAKNIVQSKPESLHSPIHGTETSSAVEAEEEDSESDEETTIILKNQHIVDDEACLDIPLLNPKHEARYRAYREAYAHLLYIWDMPLARSEVLKFNFYSITNPSEHMDIAPDRQAGEPKTQASDGLKMVPTCLNCGEDSVKSVDKHNQCDKCHAVQAGLPCSMCGESVHGLYKSCLVCGHVTHLSCVVDEHFDGEADQFDECGIGCGCLCDGGQDIAEDSHQVIDNTELRERVREELKVKEWSRQVAVFD